MGPYISAVVLLLMVWLVVGAWRLRSRRVTPGSAAAGAMHGLLSQERRAAVEVIVEERTADRDPEHRDGRPVGGQ